MSKYYYVFYNEDKLSRPILSHSSDIKEYFTRKKDFLRAFKKTIHCYHTEEETIEIFKKINKMTTLEVMDDIASGVFVFFYSDVAILSRENYKAYTKVIKAWKFGESSSSERLEFLTDFINYWSEDSFCISSADTMEKVEEIEKIEEKDSLTIYLLDGNKIVRDCARVKIETIECERK